MDWGNKPNHMKLAPIKVDWGNKLSHLKLAPSGMDWGNKPSHLKLAPNSVDWGQTHAQGSLWTWYNWYSVSFKSNYYESTNMHDLMILTPSNSGCIRPGDGEVRYMVYTRGFHCLDYPLDVLISWSWRLSLYNWFFLYLHYTHTINELHMLSLI